MVHEIHHELLFLGQDHFLLLNPVRPGTGFHAEPEQGQRARRRSEQEEEHAAILERGTAASSFKIAWGAPPWTPGEAARRWHGPPARRGLRRRPGPAPGCGKSAAMGKKPMLPGTSDNSKLRPHRVDF